MKKIWGICIIMLICSIASAGAAKETYYYLSLDDLIFSSEESLNSIEKATFQSRRGWQQRRLTEDFLFPTVLALPGDSMFLIVEDEPESGQPRAFDRSTNSWNRHAMRIAVKSTRESAPSGILFYPKADWSGMQRFEFSVPDPPADQDSARTQFLKAKERYYQRLQSLGISGSAWFRHQARHARLARGVEETSEDTNANGAARWRRQSDIDESYALFSGGRAISENMQLDRELQILKSGEDTIPIADIQGITTAEIDWTPIVEGLNPKKDVLADLIPADQHVFFFPSFQAMTDLIDEATAQATPLLRLLEFRAEDAQSFGRYQRQLCLELDLLSRTFGPQLITSVAFTGFDPYLRTGTDVAVLFETTDPETLKAAINARYTAALTAVPDTQAVNGTLGEMAYNGVVSPFRTISSYMIDLGNAVAVSNSLAQLERILQARESKIPAIAGLDEYTFFRDRYAAGASEENALLIITDATIRRWCGPELRIGAARRSQAAAVLSELQAGYVETLTYGSDPAEILAQGAAAADLGELRMAPNGMASLRYNTLDFLTPLLEMPLEKVTQEEAAAYDRFRSAYQRRWSWFFDPIAIRISLRSGRLSTDVTVRPVIASSSYRSYMDVTEGVSLPTDAGDIHPQALLHYVMALNMDSMLMQEAGNFLTSMSLQALNWAGSWLAVYVDDAPFWQELAQTTRERGSKAAKDFFESHLREIPAAIAIDVKNPLTLAAFLTSLRAFAEQTAPGLLVWEALQHNEQPYVKITPSQAMQEQTDELAGLAIYYAAMPDMFTLSLREDMIHQALERRQGPSESGKTPEKQSFWQGESLGLRVSQKALDFLRILSQEEMALALQRRAWGNIPILNEWRRLGQDSAPDFHEQYWQVRLVCPGGGEYVWNEEFQSYESTVFGHPGKPRFPEELPSPFQTIREVNMGITFEADGLRAIADVTRK